MARRGLIGKGVAAVPHPCPDPATGLMARRGLIDNPEQNSAQGYPPPGNGADAEPGFSPRLPSFRMRVIPRRPGGGAGGRVGDGIRTQLSAVAGRPFDKWGEMEETYRFVHEFKPELFKAKLEEATAERVLHEHGGARNLEGRNQHSTPREPDQGQGDNVTLIPARGNAVPYLVARLKRDATNSLAPNHAQAKAALARLQAGEITSAHSAGIAAGIPRPPDQAGRGGETG